MATVTQQIAQTYHDAAQAGTTTTVDGTVLNANAATHWIGLIFNDFEELEGTIIDDAHLECYFTSGSYDDPKVTIRAEDDDTGYGAWAGATNEISGITPTTTAVVTWDENNVGTGWNNSPDIKTIIQEIVDHEDVWTSGRFVIIIQGVDGTSLMRIRAYDGSSTEAAKLVVNYHAPSVLHEATAADTLDVTDSHAARRTFRATVNETIDLSGAMGRRADYTSSLVDILALVGTAAPTYTVRRLAADTWQLAATAGRRADFIATAADNADYADAGTYFAASESGTIDADAYEDGNELADGTVNIAATSQDCYSGVPLNALEFRDLDVPYLAIPVAAYLKVWPVTHDDPGLTIRADKTHSPAALSTTTDDISDRTLTTAGAAWNAANVGTGAYRNSPDISAVLQEVFALPGWTRGTSDLVLVLTDNATGGRLAYVTSEGTEGQRPVLHIEWVTNGVILQAEAADVIEYMQDLTRRKVAAALTADALGLTAAVTSIIGVLSADALGLADAVGTLSRLAVGDALLFDDGVFSAYAMSLTEPVKFSEMITRLATYRAASVDALRYTAGLKTTLGTAAGDDVTLAQALTARRIFTAAVNSGAWLTDAGTSGDLPELLIAIATDALDLMTLANADWATRATAVDTVALAGQLATVRRFVGLATDAGAVDDVAAAMKRARAGATDAAGFADALRSIMRTRAADALDMNDAAIADVAAILRALAADVLALDERTALNWTVNARDRLGFVATVATLMHWIEELSDTVGVSGVTAVFLPHGWVRVQFVTNGVTVSFDVAMPSIDIELIKH